MADLVSWLLEQITEDEEAAKSCAVAYPPPWDMYDRGSTAYVLADAPDFPQVVRVDQQRAPNVGWLGDTVTHVATWDPARVLAECTAKRNIIEWHAASPCKAQFFGQLPYIACACLRAYPCPTLRHLAQPYADRPGYQEEWRP